VITAFDKALVATIMGIVGIANVYGFHFGISQDTVTQLVEVATPVLIYLLPNKGETK
jgi:hypothetical protein